MDLLLSEINNKRKDLQDPAGSSRPNKYMRKGDIERAREEEERKKKAEEDRKKREEKAAREKEKVSNHVKPHLGDLLMTCGLFSRTHV